MANTIFVEVLARGFDGSTDDTDSRVLWVQAPGLDYVKLLLAKSGAPYVTAERMTMDVSEDDVDFILPTMEGEFVGRLFSFVLGDVHSALKTADSFMSGFEDDDVQEGMDEMLKQVRDAVELTK